MYKTHQTFLTDYSELDREMEGAVGVFQNEDRFYFGEIDPSSIGSISVFGLRDYYSRKWNLIHVFPTKNDWWKYRCLNWFEIKSVLLGKKTIRQARDEIKFYALFPEIYIIKGMESWEDKMTEEFGDESWRTEE